MKKVLARNNLLNLEPEYDLDETLVDSIINECDKNGDGVIDYNEFLDAVSNTNWSKVITYVLLFIN